MMTKNYNKPNIIIIDYISRNNLMVGIGSESTFTQMGNAATVKPFDDEEDEDYDYNHEVWDEEE